jgi:RNA polymerase sigma-70 factor (ECF subfamily)
VVAEFSRKEATVIELEDQIRDLLAAGDLQASATRAIEGYGPEVFGFLVTMLANEEDASEVFSQACEDLWRGLPHFQGRASLRTWFYTITRHAAARFRRAPEHRTGRYVALSEVSDVAEQARSRSLPYLRTSVKDGVARIRAALSEDDRALLVLRVDREMSWSDVARVFASEDESDEALGRLEARLRKRFQTLKDEIHEKARAARLLSDLEP